jgi:ketosteroid isomerase-like protein
MKKGNKLLMVLFLVLSAQMIKAQDKVSDSQSLLSMFQQQTEAWKVAYNSKNAQNLLPLYTGEATYISSHVSGLVAEGRDKLIANFQNGMNMGGTIDSIEIIEMQNSCDLTTLLCKYQATNNGVTVCGRNLLVLIKVEGRWLIKLHMTVV